MIVIKGYNTRLKQKVELLINEDRAILGLERWKNIRTGSVKRYTEQKDIEGKMLFEDDVIVSNLNGEEMTIRYGRYNAYCPEDHCEMENIGFYVESTGREDMPLGPTEEYALRK